jgi:hypothetical protein
MTTYTGYRGSSITYDGTGGQSVNVTTADPGVVFDAWLAADTGAGGTLTSNLPISEPELTLQGNRGFSGGGHESWYNRFHIEPSPLEAGNILADTTATFSLWNGWRGQKTLIEITDNGETEGIVVTPPDNLVPPYPFAGYEEQTFTVNIAVDGPSQIDAVFWFITSSGESVELEINGQRIFAWTFKPDWSVPVEERLEWVTDVLTSYNGNEQRIALRTNPRRTIDYQFMIDNGSDRRKFEAMLFNWGARTWMMPVWMEGQTLTSEMTAGATSMVVTRQDGNWQDGGYCIVMTAAFEYEIIKISTISGDTVNFRNPTELTWPAGSVYYPAVTGIIGEKQGLTRFNGDTEYGRCTFQILETETVGADSPTTYRGMPVITEPPHWQADITNDYARKLRKIDYRVGKFAVEDEAGMPFSIISHHWTCDGKAEIDSLRKFVYARAGKQKAVWLPTFANDLLVVGAIGSSSTYIDVEHCFIVRHLWGHMNRRDIMIEMVNGNRYYRRVTDAVELSTTVERLTINSAIGVAADPEDIRRVSWLALARFDSDSISLAWRHDDWVDCSMNWRTVRDDV